MIQFDKDGVTLFYIDATGKRISHNYLEGTAYDDMLTVMGAQKAATLENAHSVDLYTTSLANAQTSVDAGRGNSVSAPQKPLQHLVSDTGVSAFVPFVPPLPDLVPQAAVAPSTGIAQVVPDKQAIMYNMILAMFRKTFPDA